MKVTQIDILKMIIVLLLAGYLFCAYVMYKSASTVDEVVKIYNVCAEKYNNLTRFTQPKDPNVEDPMIKFLRENGFPEVNNS